MPQPDLCAPASVDARAPASVPIELPSRQGASRRARGDTARAAFGSVAVAFTKLRPGARVSLTPCDPHEFTFDVVIDGFVSFEVREARVSVGQGGALLLADDQPHTLQATSGSGLLSITAPQDILLSAGIPSTESYVSIVRGSNPLVPPLQAFALSLVRDNEAAHTPFSRYYVERSLNDLLLGVLVSLQPMRPGITSSRIYERALAIIAAQFADTELTAQSVADEVNLSRRQLERLFRARETTIGDEIRVARLTHAVALLRDPVYDALSIDAIAGYAGFSAGSSLARAMRAAGLGSPTAMRAQRSAAAQTIPDATSAIPDATPVIPNATVSVLNATEER